MPEHVLGKDCIAYRNTGTYGSPTWSAVTAMRDVNLSSEATKVDVSRRAIGNKQYAPAQLDIGVEANLVWKPADAGACEAIRDAHFNKTSIDMAFASGAIATTGTEYLRAEWGVFKFARGEELEGAMMVDISLAPFSSTNAAAFTEVA